MSLAAETDSSKIGQALARGIAQAMLADLCFLITLGEDKSLAITCGYDLIREENLGGTTIDRESIPLLCKCHPARAPAAPAGQQHLLGSQGPGPDPKPEQPWQSAQRPDHNAQAGASWQYPDPFSIFQSPVECRRPDIPVQCLLPFHSHPGAQPTHCQPGNRTGPVGYRKPGK